MSRRIERILELTADDVDEADVYFLLRVARAADDVSRDASTDELFEILAEEDEVETEPTDAQRRALGAAFQAAEGDVMAEPLKSMLDALPDPDAVEYDIEIIDQGFEPGTYDGWSVQFKALGAPKLSYQTQDPILEAFVRLEKAPEGAPRLGTGGSTALARTSEGTDIAAAMMGGGAEGGVLRGFTGAALVEVAPVVVGNAPVALPSDERIAEACGRSLRAHLEAVKAERARLAVTETTEASVIGKRLKVKT